MVRNWSIIEAILERLEAAETPSTVVKAEDFDDFSDQEVAYHMRLLKEAGCIEANIMESNTGDNLIAAALARRLKNPGHELLDVMRSESVWSKVKEKFREKGISMSVDMALQVGKQYIKNELLS